MDSIFNQKKINHIFHYTPQYETLKKILRNGFAPSYCFEKINKSDFLIPMVSFCNLPIKDVDHYMDYGKYGIGMTVEWAIKNNLSPVIYIHETTPFSKVINLIYDLSSSQFIKKKVYETIQERTNFQVNSEVYPLDEKEIIALNDTYFKIVQFLKNWKTKHNGQDIVTYNEREWRYIPNLIDKKRLITTDDTDFNIYQDKKQKKEATFTWTFIGNKCIE